MTENFAKGDSDQEKQNPLGEDNIYIPPEELLTGNERKSITNIIRNLYELDFSHYAYEKHKEVMTYLSTMREEDLIHYFLESFISYSTKTTSDSESKTSAALSGYVTFSLNSVVLQNVINQKLNQLQADSVNSNAHEHVGKFIQSVRPILPLYQFVNNTPFASDAAGNPFPLINALKKIHASSTNEQKQKSFEELYAMLDTIFKVNDVTTEEKSTMIVYLSFLFNKHIDLFINDYAYKGDKVIHKNTQNICRDLKACITTYVLNTYAQFVDDFWQENPSTEDISQDEQEATSMRSQFCLLHFVFSDIVYPSIFEELIRLNFIPGLSENIKKVALTYNEALMRKLHHFYRQMDLSFEALLKEGKLLDVLIQLNEAIEKNESQEELFESKKSKEVTRENVWELLSFHFPNIHTASENTRFRITDFPGNFLKQVDVISHFQYSLSFFITTKEGKKFILQFDKDKRVIGLPQRNSQSLKLFLDYLLIHSLGTIVSEQRLPVQKSKLVRPTISPLQKSSITISEKGERADKPIQSPIQTSNDPGNEEREIHKGGVLKPYQLDPITLAQALGSLDKGFAQPIMAILEESAQKGEIRTWLTDDRWQDLPYFSLAFQCNQTAFRAVMYMDVSKDERSTVYTSVIGKRNDDEVYKIAEQRIASFAKVVNRIKNEQDLREKALGNTQEKDKKKKHTKRK